jgi:membrane fusion protein
MVLSTDESLGSGPWVSQQVERSLEQQKGDVRSQISLADKRNRVQAQLLEKSIAGLAEIERQLVENLRQQAESASLAREEVEKSRALLGKGFATERDVGRLQREYLAQLDSRMAVEQRLSQVRSETSEIRTQIMQLPTEREDRTAELRLRMGELEQRVTEAQRSRSYVLRAPVAGRVSGLQAHVGQVAAVSVPLVSILPERVELEAQLLVPTRSAGFIAEAQEIRLMYDAFPYQRFGLYTGRVSTVARVAMTPEQLTGPVRVEEPVYPVRAKLAQQTVSAYGRPVPLQPGMSLKADVLLEEQSILDWLLEPLYSLRGRL